MAGKKQTLRVDETWVLLAEVAFLLGRLGIVAALNDEHELAGDTLAMCSEVQAYLGKVSHDAAKWSR